MRGHAKGPFDQSNGAFGNIRVQALVGLDVVAKPTNSIYVNASPTDPVKITFLPWVTTALTHGTNALTMGTAGSPTAYLNVTSLGSTGLGTAVTFVLIANTNIVSSLTSSAIAASLLLTFTGVGIATETVVVGATTYTYRASVSTTANEVKIGASAAESAANLISAINASAGGGTTYGSLTVANANSSAAAGAGTTVLVSAKTPGTAGNSIAVSETLTNGSWAGGATALAGGDSASSSGAVTVFLDT